MLHKSFTEKLDKVSKRKKNENTDKISKDNGKGELLSEQHFAPYDLNFICVATRLSKCTAIVKPSTWNACFATKKFYHLPDSHTAEGAQHKKCGLLTGLLSTSYQHKKLK